MAQLVRNRAIALHRAYQKMGEIFPDKILNNSTRKKIRSVTWVGEWERNGEEGDKSQMCTSHRSPNQNLLST